MVWQKPLEATPIETTSLEDTPPITSHNGTSTIAESPEGVDKALSLKVHPIKVLAWIIGGSAICFLAILLWEKPYRPTEQIVFVDTKEIIKLTSEGFAKEDSNSLYPMKKLEAYKSSLIQNLNEFGEENHYIIFGTNQVFGNIPDVTEEFVVFVEQRRIP